jgi:hypothetical protein
MPFHKSSEWNGSERPVYNPAIFMIRFKAVEETSSVGILKKSLFSL